METIKDEGYEVCLNDILNNAQGKNEDGKANSAYILELGSYATQKNEVQINSSRYIHAPECRIEMFQDSVNLDLIFPTPFELEFRSLDVTLKQYAKDFNKVPSKNVVAFPVFKLSVVPLIFYGQFLIELSQPMLWYYIEPFNTVGYRGIRFVFPIDNMRVIETEGYDLKEIIAEEQRRSQEVANYHDAYERRKAEEDAYEEERQRKIEELKRNKEW